MSKKYQPTFDQQKVLENESNFAIVSASAGTGKTATIIEYIASLVERGVDINRILVVTFTNNAANEMKERLLAALMEKECSQRLLEQIDDILVSDISTIHSFLQKMIKRNIDKLQLAEDFALLDENKSQEVKERAFVSAYDSICEDEKFENLILSMRKEKDLLKDVTFSLETHFASLADPEKSFEYYRNHQDEILLNAENYLNNNLKLEISRIISGIEKILNCTSSEDKNFDYIQGFRLQLMMIGEKKSLRENVLCLQNMQFGRMPSLTKADPRFLELREDVKVLISKFKDFDSQVDAVWEVNPLTEKILDFYKIYLTELKKIKTQENVLDFDDLEKLSLELLKDESVIDEIQDSFDYVFIDEYQDTNPVQEKIMKVFAKKCKFMAVGDPKQGIYGFRNATSEIMKEDISKAEERSGAYYLRSNFRSDPHILNFINKVFSLVMRVENTGISYKDTSMLDGKAEFLGGEKVKVRIDVIEDNKEKSEPESADLYDLLSDNLITKDNHKLEAQVIARRVNELLLTKIYDPKTKTERSVNYSDITILVRGRGGLVDRITEEFAKAKIPLLSTATKELSSSEEIDVVKNLLRIALDIEDDIALSSVLASKIGGYPLEELVSLRLENRSEKFFNLVKNSSKFAPFFESLNEFKICMNAKGIRFALEKLFAKTDYFAYLLSKPDGINQKDQVEKLLNLIESSDYNFDLPGLFTYLNSSQVKVAGAASFANAVRLTTIHASKGLEYPIVILAGMGKDLNKKDSRGNGSKFKFDNSLGLGMVYLDYESDIKEKSVLLSAISEKNRRKEFVDEIMLLYVAMTRAKNHLYLVGEGDTTKIKEIERAEDVFKKKSYLEIVLSAMKSFSGDKTSLLAEGIEINEIFENMSSDSQSLKLLSKPDEKLTEKIREYLNFKYPHTAATRMRYKNSVTEINENREEKEIVFVGGEENLEKGNLYHKALEILDFQKIENEEDIINQISEIDGFEKLDLKLVLKNVKIIKNIIKNNKVYKEKQFTMKIKSSEINENSSDEEIMIQGIVDLFVIGEKNILIDYKYTNLIDESKLINKYKKQLILYKKAVENAYMLHLDEIYLLSLKYGKIIKVNI